MKKRFLWPLAIIVILVAGLVIWANRFGIPEDFADQESQFKYGSIGTDHPLTRARIPYWIWKVLPELFEPAQVIQAGFGPTNHQKGYAAFGLMWEADMAKPIGHTPGQAVFERPIGLSKRSVFGLDFVGVNCAFCHVSSLRKTADDKDAQIILGGTGNTIDIEKFFLYLFAAVSDERFTADAVMDKVLEQNKNMGLIERAVYRYALIPYMRYAVPGMKKQFDFIDPANPQRLPKFGPGRVDTWAAYKRTFLDPPQEDRTAGVADFPPIWNQKARLGMRLHWDGNTDVLEERNIISALALIGPRLEYMDVTRLKRVTDFSLGLLPPRYEDQIPNTIAAGTDEGRNQRRRLAERGRIVFEGECADCHAPSGMRVGRVEPIHDLATEPDRIKAFTHELADALNQLETSAWKLRDFKPQHGYANLLLDAIWLRGPYLHNGSVPTLRDLLNRPEDRPKRFCRGSDVYDWESVGFASAMSPQDGATGCGEYFVFDTTQPGNGNQGHFYGTSLSEADKTALLAFLTSL
ncbi:MAG: hypothetical protein WA210_04320 [Burkholderiaceae bacterium]